MNRKDLQGFERILFFDGVCNLCNRSVDFVVRNDPKGRIKVAPLQGDTAAELLKPDCAVQRDPESLILWDQGRVYSHSGAALRIAGYLRFPWFFLVVLLILPPFIRDWVYRYVARNRYKWFGKKESCRLPQPHERERFLD